MLKKILIISVLTVFLAACATPYKPAGTFRNGFTDYKIDSNTAFVGFKGNGGTSEEKVHIYLVRRCAEVTKENGFDYFIMNDKVKRVEHTSTGVGYYDTQDITVKDKNGNKQTVSRDVYVPGDVQTSSHYKGSATIKMYHGTKPAGNPNAYNANDVLAHTQAMTEKKR